MVEFRINPRTGDWILIEMNGRFWGSLPLAVAAGVDFPWYLYEMLVNGKDRFPHAYRTEIYCRNTTQELKWLAQNARADHSDPTLCTVPWKNVAKEVFNLTGFREHNDTLVVDDPMPGIAEIGSILRLGWSRACGKLVTGALSIRPVRRLKALRASRLIRDARTILFVCHGNICRSPFAEMYARRMLHDAETSGTVSNLVRVLSSGYFPRQGRNSPDSAQRAAEGFGVSLAAHRSGVLSAGLVEEADVILVFDRDNLRQVRSRFPRAAGKILLLGVFISDGGVEIEDPYGREPDEFTDCYMRIAAAVARIVDLRKRPAVPTPRPADAT
jgi:protein-tyrosine-phosphatase